MVSFSVSYIGEKKKKHSIAFFFAITFTCRMITFFSVPLVLLLNSLDIYIYIYIYIFIYIDIDIDIDLDLDTE